MSPDLAKLSRAGAISRSLPTVDDGAVALSRGSPRASELWSMPSIGCLARRVERRDDDAVGILEAGGELGEQVAHARVAVRLDHGDDAPARAGPGGLQHGGDLDGVVAVVVVDRHAVPRAGELEAPLDAGEAGDGLRG